MIKIYTEQYAQVWLNSSTQFPEMSGAYLKSEKLKKEQILDRYLSSIKSLRQDRFRNRSFTEAEQQKFLDNMRGLISEGLDFSFEQMELMFSDQMIALTRSFVKKAKEFDQKLSIHDIFQACRNVWIMNGLQLIMDLPLRLTPSIFAYSLLYPYTDNLIDDPNISGFEKILFSNRFRERLSGELLKPQSETEEAIYKLVEMIESEFSRLDYPEVFDSLLAIHDAQTESLKLIQQQDIISEIEILKICLAKGGASVLADGFLIAGRLTEKQKFFLFGYGGYLQLLDDFQDVGEDHQAGLMTVFSKSVYKEPLDEKVNRTYWFGEEVMKSLDFFGGKNRELFQSLMRHSMDLFIAEAIAQVPHACSKTYQKDFERYSPFHFSYIRKLRTQFASYNGFLPTAIEEFAFSENLIFQE